MRFKLFSVLAVLLFVGSNDARPPIAASPEVAEKESPVATDSKDVSSWRPIEQRSSSVVQSDSRYRGRMDNSRKFNDRRYRLTPGILNSFKTDEDFGFSNNWHLLGVSNALVNDSINSLGFSVVKPEVPDRSIKQTSIRKIDNDKFSKIYSSPLKGLEIVDDIKLIGPDIRLDDHDSAKAIETVYDGKARVPNNSSRVSVTAKNRVVIRPSSHNIPLRYESNLQPVSLVRTNSQGNMTNQELKNWPNEPIQDIQDLFNYEKYTSSIEGTSDQSSALNYGDAPIYSGPKKKKKKKPTNQSYRPGTNYNQSPVSSYHDEDVVTHHKVPTVTPEAFGSSGTYNREPLMQPNVQEIIQWLQIPAFTAGMNQSHLAQGVQSGEPVTNSFNQNYHGLQTNKPMTPSGSHYEPQHVNPSFSGTTQSHLSDRPTSNNYHQLVQSPKPDSSLHNNYPPPQNSYQQLDNHNKRPDSNYHLSQSVNKPLTTLGSLFEPPTTYPDALVTAQSYVEDNPDGSNYYQQVPSQNPNQPPDNHYQILENPTEQSHYSPPQKPFEQLENHYPRPDNNYQSTQNFYPPANNNYPITETVRPLDTVNLPTSVVNLLTDLANKKQHAYRRPIFRPSSEISQNTVVHILNPGSKKPNVTVSEMNIPQLEKPSGSTETNSSAGAPPNVHIMFMNEDMPNPETATEDKVPEPVFQGTNCPTIMINSITRVNNTIESKEGCTDLNIVINSQVLSTNVFKPGGLSGDNDSGEDKNVGNVSSESSQEYPNDNSVSTEDPNSGSTYGNYASDTGEAERDPDRNDLFDTQALEDEAFTATSEVVSESQVIVNTGNSQEAAFDALGGGIAEESAASPAAGEAGESVAAAAPEAAPASITDPGAAVGQALAAPASGSASGIQLPSIPGISGAAGPLSGLTGGLSGLSGGNGGNGGGSPGSTALATVDDDDDDDDDDDAFDMSPSGLMESMGSVFTYFTFLNPLNYSIFSLAAAPFVAMAAGVIGIATIFFPWALPGVLDLGRAADKVTIRFRPSLDEVVKQSMYKYRDWHEWKSKRRKRKRRSTQERLKSSSDQHQLKDLQSMDQSLRTVATQLLNVTNPDETTNDKDTPKLVKGELPANVLLLRKPVTKHVSVNDNQQNFEGKPKSDMELVQEINAEISSLESMGVGFGRPTNSKFGYFESSHPGQAMALTEEELERELMSTSTRLMTAHKNHPTTTGGISTWILLNSPTTTSKPLQDYNNNKNNDDKQVNVQVRLQTKVTTPVKIFETTVNTDMKSVSTDEKPTSMASTTPMERITTLTKSTTPIQKKTTVPARPTTTTQKPVKTTQNTKTAETVTWSSTSLSGSTKKNVKVTSPKPITVTKKPVVSSRPTQKLKPTTPKPANVTSKPMTTKLGRPNQSGKPKTTPTRKPTTKLAAETTKNPSTSKIEKVTFRPVQMITTPKSLIESVERPMFITKIKTSFVADSDSRTTATTQSVTTSTVLRTENIKSNFTDGDLIEISMKPKPQPTKTNNVLKVQLKKPIETQTKIEIEPIKVNAPVLKIEKIDDKDKVMKTDVVKSSTPAILDNSQIDLKFDFNPELTRIDVETSTNEAPSSTTSKRPHKRKKNKVRRRKPTTSATTSIATSAATQDSTTLSTITIPTTTEYQEIQENLTVLGIADNSIQESKVVPESKVSPNNTKNKKKQVQKPIGTQIYNFLSREVMPSFGVMSLVGLGLGLASYFLYPFGGVIARRNYVVEPNYKYNLDEYGGNYGQNEEEVFSKVLQGMTNNDGKYGGIKDYENNFYRYQQFDGAYTAPQTTRKGDPRYPTSSATAYRPLETTAYDTKFRNTEFKYPDIPTTPNYYERHKQEFIAKKPGHGDRQFVVGNVPKEYGFADKGHSNFPPTTQAIQSDFERDIAQNHKFVSNTADISPNYEQPEAQALKANEGYEEIEITPAAVAVEHGPRSLNSDSPRLRKKRESVIQLIPSRTEIEKEEEEIEKEEPLSNEILDIIDSVIPEDMIGVGKIIKTQNEKHGEKKNEAEKAVQNDDSRQVIPNADETTVTTTQAALDVTATAVVDDKAATESASVSTTTIMDSTSTTSTTDNSLTIDEILGATTDSSGKDPEDSSVEWFDHSTTEKPHDQSLGVFGFVKKIAEVKLRLGLAILKHASEGFARYLGHIQKRVNGEE